MNILESTVKTDFNNLDNWVTENGWAGFDPYDIKGQDWYVNIFGRQNFFCRKIRGFFALIEMRSSPMMLRKLFRVEKTINAKGMGLMASAYLSLFRSTQEDHYLSKAESILDWLHDNYSKEYKGISWGYPFHWQSRVFFPKGTPSSVVTGTVGDAWLEHYLITGSERSFDVCRGIADFFLTCLNRYEKKPGQLCFSYTPLDNFRVHNASLFVANFLARFGKIEKNSEFINFALNAVRYTISEQNQNGSFYYWGTESPSIIDHYHTGFVLRHLSSIKQSSGDDSFADKIKIGYEYYRTYLFEENGLPKFTPESVYPIDIHSFAEAILTLTQLEENPRVDSLLCSVIDFAKSKMLTKDGYYIAEIRKRWWGEQKVDIAYMRWGQCWMLLALARLYEKILKK